MHRSRRRVIVSRNARKLWHPRACVRRAVTLRVDYATAQGRVGLGLVRNLSVQGMYIDSALRHVAPEVAPGALLTVAFVLPTGQPCKLRAVVVHCDRHGCGVQFQQGAPQAHAHLAHYGASLEAEAAR
jgi:PilZ domain